MKIAVCIKQVPTREWQPRLNDDKTWVRDQDVSYEMNEPDAYALEEALRLREKHGGEVVVCSAGPARVQQVIREALARGADRALHVEDDALGAADAFTAAAALAAGDGRAEVRPDPHRPAVRRSGPRAVRPGAGREAVDSALDDHHGSERRSGRQRLAARQARARRRLVPVRDDAAAGAADDPERHQSAALRDAEGHHGGEEERDRQGRGAAGPRRAPEDRRRSTRRRRRSRP